MGFDSSRDILSQGMISYFRFRGACNSFKGIMEIGLVGFLFAHMFELGGGGELLDKPCICFIETTTTHFCGFVAFCGVQRHSIFNNTAMLRLDEI